MYIQCVTHLYLRVSARDFQFLLIEGTSFYHNSRTLCRFDRMQSSKTVLDFSQYMSKYMLCVYTMWNRKENETGLRERILI